MTARTPHFILASASPRRRRLLKRMGFAFHVKPAAFSEERLPGEEPVSYTQRVAREKCRIIGEEESGSWILGADTVVVFETHILGKPRNSAEACAMLEILSGRRHRVITSYCLHLGARALFHVRSVETQVLFKELRPEEVARYVETGEAMDKAGAYAVQGLGAFMVRAVYGSYSNVVGLPLAEVIESLVELGVIRSFPLDIPSKPSHCRPPQAFLKDF